MSSVAQSQFVRGLERRYEAILAAEHAAGLSTDQAHDRAFPAVKALGVRALAALCGRGLCLLRGERTTPDETDGEA